jgi:hypothetical protein
MFFKVFSQREKPYRVGFVICVGEKPLKNPCFALCVKKTVLVIHVGAVFVLQYYCPWRQWKNVMSDLPCLSQHQKYRSAHLTTVSIYTTKGTYFQSEPSATWVEVNVNKGSDWLL